MSRATGLVDECLSLPLCWCESLCGEARTSGFSQLIEFLEQLVMKKCLPRLFSLTFKSEFLLLQVKGGSIHLLSRVAHTDEYNALPLQSCSETSRFCMPTGHKPCAVQRRSAGPSWLQCSCRKGLLRPLQQEKPRPAVLSLWVMTPSGVAYQIFAL